MTPDDQAESIRRMVYIQSTLSQLRDYIDVIAATSKSVGAFGLAFAAFHLSDSIAAYAREVSKFLMEEDVDE